MAVVKATAPFDMSNDRALGTLLGLVSQSPSDFVVQMSTGNFIRYYGTFDYSTPAAAAASPVTGFDVATDGSFGDVVLEVRGLVATLAAFDVRTEIALRTRLLLGDDTIIGSAGDDVLVANAGQDTLDGGAGADTLAGGSGNDLYRVENAGDVVIEDAAAGTDRVESAVSFVLGANLEDLTLSGSADLDGTGNALANRLVGNGGANRLDGGNGNDTLDGGAGVDTLIGGNGDDTFLVDDSGDAVVEAANGGKDTVRSTAASYTLGDNVEILVLDGTDNIGGTGNALANTLTGNAGNNRLDGGAGADTLIGGNGDDTYVIDGLKDKLVDSGGIDTVEAGFAYTLGLGFERLVLLGFGDIGGTGNAAANTLVGNAGANKLDGGKGADTLAGGLGDDTYLVDDLGDSVVEAADEGRDRVLAAVDHTLAAHVEELVLSGKALRGIGNDTANTITGNALANTLEGGEGADTLDGGAGTDTLVGGAGGDTYLVDNLRDVVVEQAFEGEDCVSSSVTWALGAEIEHLVLRGAAKDGTGNDLANRITGTGGANKLDGAGGADTLIGGAGDDIYVVDDAGDQVIELAGGGKDTVRAGLDFALGAEVESLILTGAGDLAATGNAFANTLTGNGGANRLDGGAGADTLIGGNGNDTYVVDNLKDKITETAPGGIDTVESGIGWTLGSFFENLVLTGTGDTGGTGNALANAITGNAGANRIEGAGGADTLTGGGGADRFVWKSLKDGGDTITDMTIGAGGDVLDLKPLVTGYKLGVSAVGDFVRLTATDAGIVVAIDGNGAVGGGKFADLCLLQGAAGDVTVEGLLASGNLFLG